MFSVIIFFFAICFASTIEKTTSESNNIVPQSRTFLLWASFLQSFDEIFTCEESFLLYELAVRKWEEVEGGLEGSLTNNMFYEMQIPKKSRYLNLLFSSDAEFTLLVSKANQRFTQTMQELFQVSNAPEISDSEIFCWASVHPYNPSSSSSSSSGHDPHVHKTSKLSSVYYPKNPTVNNSRSCLRSKPLTFMDPRGGLPPFGGLFVHKPEENGMVVFPSWMVHYVSFSSNYENEGSFLGSCEGYRTSFSCNLAGDWSATGDLNIEM